jgi:branched-subunit amino acid transport protein
VSLVEKAWLTVVLGTITTFAIRGAGPMAMAGRTLGRRATRVLALLPAALLSALVVTETVIQDRSLDVDARTAGVGAAALLVWRGVSVIWVVIGAAAVTALLRLVF